MTAAKSLRDLLRIRKANRQLFDDIPNLGTALGYENGNGPPAIIVFVPRKIHEKWLPNGVAFPGSLTEPQGLTCPIDVIGLNDLEDFSIPTPVSDANLRLRDGLRGAEPVLQPGSQLAAFGLAGETWWGTLAAMARDRKTGALGLITNQHVGGFVGNVLKFPDIDSRPIAIVKRQRQFIPDEVRFGSELGEPNAYYLVDCAFAEFFCDIDPKDDIEPRISVMKKTKGRGRRTELTSELRTLGEPLRLDLDSMGPIGRPVVGVGRTRSSQRGIIRAVAYEIARSDSEDPRQERDSPGRWIEEREYTDYVIQGTSGDQFSDGGDSGKLIVTDDEESRPVGLLWGGAQTRFRHERQTEDWTLATGIGPVLDELDVDIVSAL